MRTRGSARLVAGKQPGAGRASATRARRASRERAGRHHPAREEPAEPARGRYAGDHQAEQHDMRGTTRGEGEICNARTAACDSTTSGQAIAHWASAEIARRIEAPMPPKRATVPPGGTHAQKSKPARDGRGEEAKRNRGPAGRHSTAPRRRPERRSSTTKRAARRGRGNGRVPPARR